MVQEIGKRRKSDSSTIEGLALRLPPQDREAERAVLGAIFLEPEAISKIIDIIQAESFYDSSHRKIFSSMLDLYNRGIPPDIITIKDNLINLHVL